MFRTDYVTMCLHVLLLLETILRACYFAFKVHLVGVNNPNYARTYFMVDHSQLMTSFTTLIKNNDLIKLRYQ